MSETPRTVEQWREDERREAVEDDERDEERLRFEPARESEPIGVTLASALRDEAVEVAAGRVDPHLTCPECGGRVRSREHDGRCRRCAGLEPEDESARRHEGRRRLHRDTAMLLRRIGHPERAAWHDAEVERE